MCVLASCSQRTAPPREPADPEPVLHRPEPDELPYIFEGPKREQDTDAEDRICAVYAARRDTDLESWARTRDRLAAACGRTVVIDEEAAQVRDRIRDAKDAELGVIADSLPESTNGFACGVLTACDRAFMCQGLSASRDGKIIVTLDNDTPRLWDWKGSKWVRRKLAGTGSVLSPDATIAARLAGSVLALWDVAHDREMPSIAIGPTHLRTVAISSDNRWVVTGGINAPAKVWSIAHGTGDTLAAGIQSSLIAMSPVRPVAYVNDAIWDLATRTATARLNQPTINGHVQASCAAFSPRGDRLALCPGTARERAYANVSPRAVQLFDTTTGKLIATLPRIDDLAAIAFTLDGRFVIAGGDGFVAWQTSDGKLVANEDKLTIWNLVATTNGVLVLHADGTLRRHSF